MAGHIECRKSRSLVGSSVRALNYIGRGSDYVILLIWNAAIACPLLDYLIQESWRLDFGGNVSTLLRVGLAAYETQESRPIADILRMTWLYVTNAIARPAHVATVLYCI